MNKIMRKFLMQYNRKKKPLGNEKLQKKVVFSVKKNLIPNHNSL